MDIIDVCGVMVSHRVVHIDGDGSSSFYSYNISCTVLFHVRQITGKCRTAHL